MSKNLLHHLPSIDRLKKTEKAEELTEKYSENLFVDASRRVLQNIREEISSNRQSHSENSLSQDYILSRIQRHLEEKFCLSLRKAVNATGVILHTGLGRAVLPAGAVESISHVAEGYSTLAADLETGQRSHRDVHLDDLLCEITGAEAATVVNNNAAATMIILNTLARGKEVIVSRGQLVEIGGAFRMPDVMSASGAILKEVGTTNKTHLRDYENAISENTGAIMRVHHSNYRILGFTGEPSIEELCSIAKKHDVSIIDDLGSGALVDLKEYGIENEPLVQDSIKAGIDVACFSGDKLIGGPQSGIIVGRASIIERIRKNPLARAFRIGKLTIAALEVTLRLFLKPEVLEIHHPVYRMLSQPVDQILRRIQKIIKKIQPQITDGTEIAVIEGGSQVGSGAVPIETIPTRLLKIVPADISVEYLAKKLRQNDPPVFTRVHKGAVLLDFRTVQEKEDKIISEALITLLKEEEKGRRGS